MDSTSSRENKRDDVASLQGILAQQAEVCRPEDHARWLLLADEFRSALCELSGHNIAWALIRRVGGHLDRVRLLSLPQPRYLEEMLAEHGLVSSAVRRRDVDGAEETLRHHLRMVLGALPALLDQHPEFFADADE